LQFHRNISLNVFKRELAMRMFRWRLVLVMAIAVLLPGYPKSASAMMVNVSVGPGGNLVFDPASITINPGDQVKWTWASSGHSTTSGSPGMPNNLWDSGIHNEGATFTRTFNSAGTFPYYCTPHGGCCGMVGTVTVVNASPTPNPTPTPTPIGSATPTSILANISTRSFVQTTDNVMIGGFIVQGTQAKRVIIRAIGPELTPFGVPNVLANPTLELHDGTGNLIGFNDDWQTTVIGGVITQNQVQDIVASGKAPTDTRESAIIADLPAGNYTAIVRGVSSTTGVALVEVYDLVPEADSILANISTRSLVQTTDNVMIGGFIVQGTQPKMVIIRAIGPELTPFGVPNVLANPMLELHNGTGGLIASNDNWQTTIIGGIIMQDQVQQIINSGRAPTDPRESAIIANLPAGNYTAIVRGVSDTTGVALVEVYDLQ
jgi:plastocyanin